MNERIKQFARDAGLLVHNPEGVPTKLDKFAELIVRECVGVVEGGRFLHDQAPTAIFAKEYSAAIKKHFGVSE